VRLTIVFHTFIISHLFYGERKKKIWEELRFAFSFQNKSRRGYDECSIVLFQGWIVRLKGGAGRSMSL